MDSLNNRAQRVKRLEIKKMASNSRRHKNYGNLRTVGTHFGFILTIVGFLTVAFATPSAKPGSLPLFDLQHYSNK